MDIVPVASTVYISVRIILPDMPEHEMGGSLVGKRGRANGPWDMNGREKERGLLG